MKKIKEYFEIRNEYKREFPNSAKIRFWREVAILLTLTNILTFIGLILK